MTTPAVPGTPELPVRLTHLPNHEGSDWALCGLGRPVTRAAHAPRAAVPMARPGEEPSCPGCQRRAGPAEPVGDSPVRCPSCRHQWVETPAGPRRQSCPSCGRVVRCWLPPDPAGGGGLDAAAGSDPDFPVTPCGC